MIILSIYIVQSNEISSSYTLDSILNEYKYIALSDDFNIFNTTLWKIVRQDSGTILGLKSGDLILSVRSYSRRWSALQICLSKRFPKPLYIEYILRADNYTGKFIRGLQIGLNGPFLYYSGKDKTWKWFYVNFSAKRAFSLNVTSDLSAPGFHRIGLFIDSDGTVVIFEDGLKVAVIKKLFTRTEYFTPCLMASAGGGGFSLYVDRIEIRLPTKYLTKTTTTTVVVTKTALRSITQTKVTTKTITRKLTFTTTVTSIKTLTNIKTFTTTLLSTKTKILSTKLYTTITTISTTTTTVQKTTKELSLTTTTLYKYITITKKSNSEIVSNRNTFIIGIVLMILILTVLLSRR